MKSLTPQACGYRFTEKTMRRSIFLLATAGVFLAATSVPGSAADLGPGPVYKAPPAVFAPVFTWSGFYVGGNLGYGWASGSGTASLGGVPGTFSGSGSGFLGGAQLGYNLQTGNWVWGLEADFQGSAGDGNVHGSAGATTFNATAKTPWFGTARGRIGYAFNRSMVYGTGGLACGRNELDGTVTPGGAFSSEKNFMTWTIGAGYETMLWDRWSAKLEYLYLATPNDVPMPPGATNVDGSSTTHIVRAGLNYHF
jgi:outer membrane immunogenic protein